MKKEASSKMEGVGQVLFYFFFLSLIMSDQNSSFLLFSY